MVHAIQPTSGRIAQKENQHACRNEERAQGVVASSCRRDDRCVGPRHDRSLVFASLNATAANAAPEAVDGRTLRLALGPAVTLHAAVGALAALRSPCRGS